MCSSGCSITTRDWRSKSTIPTPAASRITCSDFATCSVSASPHACATSRSASSTYYPDQKAPTSSSSAGRRRHRYRAHHRPLGSAVTAGNVDPQRHDDVLGHAQEAVGLPASERSRQGAARGRPDRAHVVHARLDQEPRPPPPCPARLNKGEARNALARAIDSCRLGEMRDRSFENQFFRASGLNLLVAAIILWNTKYLDVAYADLRRQGRPVNEDLLRHVAPLGWEHIGLTGDYVWSTAELPAAGSLRAPAPAPVAYCGFSSLIVRDVVHSEHFRVVTPTRFARNCRLTGRARPSPPLAAVS